MDLKTKKARGKITIQLSGEVAIYSIAELYEALNAIEGLYDLNIVFDMTSVTEIDTAGIQLLVYISNRVGDGKTVLLDKVPEPVGNTVSMLGLSKLLKQAG